MRDFGSAVDQLSNFFRLDSSLFLFSLFFLLRWWCRPSPQSEGRHHFWWALCSWWFGGVGIEVDVECLWVL